MHSNEILSFCIPTYNRGLDLKTIVEKLIEVIKDYNIEICISDNDSPDSTEEVVVELQKIYPYIKYFKQPSNMGLDINIQTALQMSTTKYGWLLGDTYVLIEPEFKKIYKILQDNDLDGVLLNANLRVTDIKSKIYDNSETLLDEIGWHITMLSGLIYNRRLIKNASYNRFYGTLFIQHGIIFEHYANFNDVKFYWYEKPAVENIPKTSFWYANTLEVFGKKWTEHILSLPYSISVKTKFKCIRDHGVKANVFSYGNLVTLRCAGYISKQQYNNYVEYIKYNASPSTYMLFKLSMLAPIPLLRAGLSAYKRLKK
jgi:abequosyltransferase